MLILIYAINIKPNLSQHVTVIKLNTSTQFVDENVKRKVPYVQEVLDPVRIVIMNVIKG